MMTNSKPLPSITKYNILLLVIGIVALLVGGLYFFQVNDKTKLSCDDSCAQRLWAWADDFQISAEVLPRDKAQLLVLRELDLNRYSHEEYKNLSKINYLPPEIGQLNQLQELWVGGNQLSALPAEIGQLRQLQGLDLSDNQLSALPAEIGQLAQLDFLDVGGNQLSALPAEIGQLSQLQILYFNDNQLSALPTSISHLTKLSFIALKDNPHLSLSPEQEAFIKTIQQVFR